MDTNVVCNATIYVIERYIISHNFSKQAIKFNTC